jgi:hypothetical protein
MAALELSIGIQVGAGAAMGRLTSRKRWIDAVLWVVLLIKIETKDHRPW